MDEQDESNLSPISLPDNDAGSVEDLTALQARQGDSGPSAGSQTCLQTSPKDGITVSFGGRLPSLDGAPADLIPENVLATTYRHTDRVDSDAASEVQPMLCGQGDAVVRSASTPGLHVDIPSSSGCGSTASWGH